MKKKHLFGILAAIVVLVISAMAASYAERVRTLTNLPPLAGTIYLSMARSGEGFLRPYTLDAGTLRIQQGRLYDEKLALHHAFSPDATRAAFLGMTAEMLQEKEGDFARALQVYTAPALDQALPEIDANSQKKTAADAVGKRMLSISNKGDVLYVAMVPGIQKSILTAGVEEWGVFLNEGSEPLVRGTSPHWVTADTFVYLANDGVHLYSLGSAENTLLWASTGVMPANSRLAVSRAGDRLAWAVPDQGKIYLYRLSDGAITDMTSLDAHAFWVVFSPTGDTLAAQVVDWNVYPRSPRSRIEFFDVTTLTKYPVAAPLEAYNQEMTFLTDWN